MRADIPDVDFEPPGDCWYMGVPGCRSSMHIGAVQEQLAADRKMQQRMQEELVNMTGTLKRWDGHLGAVRFVPVTRSMLRAN